jgi:hypothetical protein
MNYKKFKTQRIIQILNEDKETSMAVYKEHIQEIKASNKAREFGII